MTGTDQSAGWRSEFLARDGEHSQWTRSSLRFVRDCFDSTPLRRHSRLAGPGTDLAGPLQEAVAQGLQLYATDLGRWSIEPETQEQHFDRLRLAPNLLATFLYRICHQLYRSRTPFWPDVLSTAARVLTGVEIYYSAEIGPGLKLIHGVGTVIGAKSRIGRNFTVFQGVTIGDKLGAETGVRPEIGDDVILSAGAQVLGPVKIGSRTIVGANAVVIRSVPGRCVVAGVPAEIKAVDLSDDRFDQFLMAIKG